MRVSLLIVLIPLIAACSTMGPAPTPSTALSESSPVDIAGRWRGNWTGAGLFPYSVRDDAVAMDLVQRGDVGQGRIVLEGTGAAESVPQRLRLAGQWGTSVVARISHRTVTLRDEVDGRLFTADLTVSEDGQRMFGLVRGSRPNVGLVLIREVSPKTDPAPAAPPQAAITPAPVTAVEAEPRPEATPAEAPARPRQEEFMAVQELAAVHFDFDKAELRADTLDHLQGHAAWLKAHADTAVLIEGHCDERGTAEYNVALGDRRAKAVRDHFAAHGIAPDRITTLSYGKERLACAADSAACHEMNRRAEFRVRSR